MAAQQDIQAVDIALRRSVIFQVERIAASDAFRQQRRQRRQRLFAQHGELAVARIEFVQRQRGRRGAVADDHQPVAAQRAHMAERFYGGEEFVSILHAQQAGALDCRIPGGV